MAGWQRFESTRLRPSTIAPLHAACCCDALLATTDCLLCCYELAALAASAPLCLCLCLCSPAGRPAATRTRRPNTPLLPIRRARVAAVLPLTTRRPRPRQGRRRRRRLRAGERRQPSADRAPPPPLPPPPPTPLWPLPSEVFAAAATLLPMPPPTRPSCPIRSTASWRTRPPRPLCWRRKSSNSTPTRAAGPRQPSHSSTSCCRSMHTLSSGRQRRTGRHTRTPGCGRSGDPLAHSRPFALPPSL